MSLPARHVVTAGAQPGARCKLKDDGGKVLDKTEECDVLIFGQPIYMGGVMPRQRHISTGGIHLRIKQNFGA